jgi:hypothetical protein
MDPPRPGRPFDVKGAIVCAAIKDAGEILVVDIDALVRRDPAPALRPFRDLAMAMPRDLGAINIKAPNLVAPWKHVAKRSAGIMWFGAFGSDHRALAAEYRTAWQELRPLHTAAGPPTATAEQHDLLEQHAWTLVAHRRGLPLLPDTFNWPRHCYGANPAAVIDHFFGWGKWGRPRNRVVNSRLTIPAALRERTLFTAGVSA